MARVCNMCGKDTKPLNGRHLCPDCGGREDLIEAILCDWDWSISRDEAERLADKMEKAK